MRTIGNRKTELIAARPSGEALEAGARFAETFSALAPNAFVEKGVTRFASHQVANEADAEALARAMAVLARTRTRPEM